MLRDRVVLWWKHFLSVRTTYSRKIQLCLMELLVKYLPRWFPGVEGWQTLAAELREFSHQARDIPFNTVKEEFVRQHCFWQIVRMLNRLAGRRNGQAILGFTIAHGTKHLWRRWRTKLDHSTSRYWNYRRYEILPNRLLTNLAFQQLALSLQRQHLEPSCSQWWHIPSAREKHKKN